MIDPLPDDSPIRKLGVGPSSDSVFFVNSNEDVYATGLNDRGQLGVGDTDNRNTLTLVEFGSQVVLNKISAGHDHTLALGTITGSLAPFSSPTPVPRVPTYSPTIFGKFIVIDYCDLPKLLIYTYFITHFEHALGGDVPTKQPTGTTRIPTYSPTIGIDPVTPLEVSITYDLSNDCGLDAEAIMSGTDNTLVEGLIEATTTITVDVLNTTFPRVAAVEDGGDEPIRERKVKRKLVHLENRSATSGEQHHGRNLVYYTDQYPVTIDRILDIETGCAPGANCLLVISSITVILEDGDDPDAVNGAIVSGLQDSFEDGTFFAAIPEDTVICP